MAAYGSKLIIVRGNSGAGKSTVAHLVQQTSHHKVALVEQDYLRRIVLKEKETVGSDHIALLHQTAVFALQRGYHVLLEGGLYSARYANLFRQLVAVCPEYYVFYLDVSFEESLKRHATKPNAHEFGEVQLRRWYRQQDLTGLPGELIIPQSSSAEATAVYIAEQAGLNS